MSKKTKIIYPKTNNMSIKDIIEKTRKGLAELTGFHSPAGIGAKKEGNEWLVTIEIVEKKSIPEGLDIMGIYEIRTDEQGNILGYERKEIRRRMDVTGGDTVKF